MGYDIDISTAASRLGISPQAVHKRVKSGTLDAQKINKSWKVSSESLDFALQNPLPKGRPHKGNDYMLMNGPYEVMEITFQPSSGNLKPGRVIDASRAPIGCVTRNGKGRQKGIQAWWEHRSIPGSRAQLDEKLAQLGVDEPWLIPFRNLGLSLSDQYWIRPHGNDVQWEHVNFFDNAFGSENPQTWDDWLSEVGLSSPDNTSEGALPKRWLCQGSRRILVKGHIPWTDQQAYNEAVATKLHEAILPADHFVPYHAERIAGLGVVSMCDNFLTRDEEYVPMSLVFDTEGKRSGETVYDAIVRVCVNAGIALSETKERLSEMIVSDYVMANSDRHLRNFGLIRNIHTLEWRFAPLFDSGNSLWYDKDESDVARGSYSWISRPFDANPLRQLYLASNTAWLDAEDLNGFADSACEILADGDISGWRLDYLRSGIEERVKDVRQMLG